MSNSITNLYLYYQQYKLNKQDYSIKGIDESEIIGLANTLL